MNSTSYTDAGLAFGIAYCYMVVAIFPDGAQSYASEEFCNLLQRDVPIMTHVSVGITDNSAGEDTIRWSNAFDLDTMQFPVRISSSSTVAMALPPRTSRSIQVPHRCTSPIPTRPF